MLFTPGGAEAFEQEATQYHRVTDFVVAALRRSTRLLRQAVLPLLPDKARQPYHLLADVMRKPGVALAKYARARQAVPRHAEAVVAKGSAAAASLRREVRPFSGSRSTAPSQERS